MSRNQVNNPDDLRKTVNNNINLQPDNDKVEL